MSPLLPVALATAFRGLASTWRFEVTGAEHHERAARGPFVYVLWHHALLPLLWWHRHRGITLLVSRHRDGELLAAPAARFRLLEPLHTGAKVYYRTRRDWVRRLADGPAATTDGRTHG